MNATTNRNRLSVAALVVLIAAALVTVLAVSAGAGTRVTESPVLEFPAEGEEPGDPVGTSHLVRTDRAVSVALISEALTPDDAYTLWWVIFNQPDGCAGDCDEDDVLDADGNLDPNPAADVSVLFADGRLAVGSTGAFAAQLAEGEQPGEVLTGSGLTNARGAEVHLVVRSHGPAVDDLLDEQLSTFAGGCEIAGGPNTCADVQFAVHQP